ncbi:ABC transporter ATP-binding protein [Companilactobacillus huachuanensis]|uniref:ABC transporter ATP-binding protein n=1 Tax=Companilactobacillus huachuanensis TaxID=2559914 RepID=A0ABW1RKX9_9LACO|nr:ABC transporter ATP-binding protein [Companilactobacillus huachuanensis]
MNDIIKCVNISVYFNTGILRKQTNYVLKKINLNIQRGNIFGIIGPSGAGKTTLLNVLTNQISYEGNVYIDGNDTVNKGADLFKELSLCSVNSGLYEELTVMDNLLLYANTFGKGKKEVSELLLTTNLHECEQKTFSKLSTGMRQRVSLIRCFLNDAPVLLLDEPTSNVDPYTGSIIRDFIVKIKEKGKTIILTTHNMFEAEQLCDQLVLLNEGVILEQGSPNLIKEKYFQQPLLITCTMENGSLIDLEYPKEKVQLSNLIKDQIVLSIHSNEPTLESIFVNLAGRKMS